MNANDIITSLNAAHANIRAIGQEVMAMRQEASQQAINAKIARAIAKGGGSRKDIQFVENIPGRRVPFDLLVSIPIAADSPGPFDQSAILSTDGPFVAVVRYATFLSNYSFQVVTGQTEATFYGRSYGRYRPVSSMQDLLDGNGGFNNAASAADPGDGTWQMVHTTNKSPFRTMEFDGTIEVRSSESEYRRQSNPVPTSLWAPGFAGATQLPCLDFFPPGATVEFHVQANHVNNPGYGNIQAVVDPLPFIDGQFDAHEGIGYSNAARPETTDTITRQPDGILLCGFWGYRIVTPAGIKYETPPSM